MRTNPKETLNGKLPFCAVFIYNLTQGNQSKLHFLIVDKAVYSYCVLYMIDLKIKSTDTVELLWITIGKNLKFKQYTKIGNVQITYCK